MRSNIERQRMMGIVYGRMNLTNSLVPSNDHTSCNPSKAKSSARPGAEDHSTSYDGADDSSSSNDDPAFRRVTRQASRNTSRREAPIVLRRSARLRSDAEVQATGGARSSGKRPSRVRRSARIALLGAAITSTGRGSAVSRITTRSRSSLINQHQQGSLSSSSMNLRRSLRHISS